MASVVVDGSNLIARAAFGFPSRIYNGDIDITPLFGFLALLRKAHIRNTGELVVVFDSETSWESRQKTDADYKQHRQGIDFSYLEFLPDIQNLLTVLGIQWFEAEHCEADDAIATIVANSHDSALIMSTDKDFYQLLDQRVSVLNTARSRSHSIVGVDDVMNQYHVHPWQWCDYRALVGDPSDGIRGVPSIGPKRAAHLLSGGRSLDDYAPPTETPFEALSRFYHSALEYRSLIELDTNVDVPVTLTGVATPPLPLAAAILSNAGIW